MRFEVNASYLYLIQEAALLQCVHDSICDVIPCMATREIAESNEITPKFELTMRVASQGRKLLYPMGGDRKEGS